ncbi:MAG: hypothetical protein K1X75_11345 [Leptospirales bacterium]|nr:hypothetical protein [Leptospirales bacterium]
MKLSYILAILVAATILLPAALLADTVFLKNGQQLEGKVIGQTRTSVTFRPVTGAVRTIAKSDIRRIAYGPTQSDAEARAEQERRDRLRETQALSAENRRLMEDEWRRLDTERNKLEEERRRIDEEWARLDRGREDSGRRPPTVSNPTDSDRLIAAFMRSLIFPGWGQYYQGRTTTGYIYAGSYLALAGATIATESAYYRLRGKYSDRANLFLVTSPVALSFLGVPITDLTGFQISGFLQARDVGDARFRQEQASRRANFLRTALVAFYAWNLVDVVIYRPSSGQSLHMGVEEDQLTLRFDVRQ